MLRPVAYTGGLPT